MALLKLICFECGKSSEFVESVGIRDECEHCHADAHCCKNCRFYDSKVYNECRETSAEVVLEKKRANFCDHFEVGDGTGASSVKKEDLRAAAEALFKKR
ncbi:MAG: hypothetical protein IPJ71_04220 [Bdellovibrionales bacterium]|nr:hypothetical protein [Bdellovibrionales bacterium]